MPMEKYLVRLREALSSSIYRRRLATFCVGTEKSADWLTHLQCSTRSWSNLHLPAMNLSD